MLSLDERGNYFLGSFWALRKKKGEAAAPTNGEEMFNSKAEPFVTTTSRQSYLFAGAAQYSETRR